MSSQGHDASSPVDADPAIRITVPRWLVPALLAAAIAGALVVAGVVSLSAVLYAGMFGGMMLMHVGGHGGGHHGAGSLRQPSGGAQPHGPTSDRGLDGRAPTDERGSETHNDDRHRPPGCH